MVEDNISKDKLIEKISDVNLNVYLGLFAVIFVVSFYLYPIGANIAKIYLELQTQTVLQKQIIVELQQLNETAASNAETEDDGEALPEEFSTTANLRKSLSPVGKH